MFTRPIQPEDAESLLRLIESAPRIVRRSQFFVWSQGDLQRWVPHQVAVCGVYDHAQRGLVFDVFNSVPLPDRVATVLRDVQSVLVSTALRLWQAGRHRPLRMALAPMAEHDATSSALLRHGYEEVLVHGFNRPGRPHETDGFFMFADARRAYDHDMLQSLDMLLYCIYLSHQRSSIAERQLSRAPAARAVVSSAALSSPVGMTTREREILMRVRDGLSNPQIGEALGISALTVKNHVQKILRKLGAANRAQAVAKAMTMHALGDAVMCQTGQRPQQQAAGIP